MSNPLKRHHSAFIILHSAFCILHSAFCIASAAYAAEAGFYRVERDAAGAWRLVNPAGEPTVWLGVDHVKFDGFRCEADGNRKHYRETNERQFGSRDAWATNTAERLRAWGFNGLGAACDNSRFKGSGLGRCVFLALGDSATAEKDDEEHWLSDNLHTPGTAFPNVFNPDFAAHCDREAAKACAPNRDDQEVLGYFIDNELAWEARRGGPAGAWGLFDNACAKPAGNTARRALEDFLATKITKEHKDSATLRLCVEKDDLLSVPVEVKREFVEFVADKYFEITTAAIRRHDPNHLVLGCRFAGTVYPDEVFRSAGKYCDIVSINGYAVPIPDRNEMLLSFRDRYYPIAETLTKLGELSGRPIMLTEWSFPAFDSGLPCLRGVGKRFDTQAERAWASALYARSVLSCPWVIGYDYFMWVDMPAKGISYRFPEDSNYGLVREDGREYAELTQAFAAIQRRDRLGFDEWRRQIQTRGPLTPPPWTPLLTEDRLDAQYLQVVPGRLPAPSFSRDGNTWCATNAAGLELRGSTPPCPFGASPLTEGGGSPTLPPSERGVARSAGGSTTGVSPTLPPSERGVARSAGGSTANKPFSSLSWHGADYGTLSAEIRAHAAPSPENPAGGEPGTHRVAQVSGATWRETPEGRGVLSLDCDLDIARMALDLTVVPGNPCLHIDVRRLENKGAEPLVIDEIALLPDTPLPEATVPPKAPRPGFVHRPHVTRAWIDRATGRTLGALSDSPFISVIDFEAGEGNARRSAVRFTLSSRGILGTRQLVLAPGEVWTPPAPLHALIRLGDAGENDWNTFAKKRQPIGGNRRP